MSVLWALLVLCLSGGARAQIVSKGSCPKMEAMKGFDIAEFVGVWYEAERYYKPTKNGVKCVSYDWRLDDRGTVTQISTVMSTRDAIRILKPALVRTPDTTKPGMLKQKYSWLRAERDLMILATDYTSYALVYNCINRRRFIFTTQNYQYAWILTREQNPDADVATLINTAVNAHKLIRTSFTKIRHDDCEVKPQ